MRPGVKALRDRIRVGVTIALVAAMPIGDVSAASVPTDPSAMTAYAADAFAKALPQGRVIVKEPLVLSVELPPQAPFVVQLHNVFDYCRRDSGRCDAAFRDFVAKSSATAIENAMPIERSQLRLVVRSTAYVD